MINTDIEQLVHQHFPQLSDAALIAEIAAVGVVEQIPAGQVLMDYGSFIKRIPLLLEGSIRVIREDDDGNELFLYYLEAGQTCSMSFTCCMMHKRSVIRTIAEEDTTLIGIPIELMDAWMTRYQVWKNFVMLTYDHRLMELVKTLDSVAFKQMDQRLIDYLKLKAGHTRNEIIQVTHSEIARELNASREAISRLLKKLEKSGVVRLARNQITLLDPHN